jgi:hypothetical protein
MFDQLTVSMLLNKKIFIKQKRFLSFGTVKRKSFNFEPFYSKFSEYYPDLNPPKKEFLE